MKKFQKAVSILIAAAFMISCLAGCTGGSTPTPAPATAAPASQAPASQAPASTPAPAPEPEAGPIKFTAAYFDNPTFPFRADWPSKTECERIANVAGSCVYQVYVAAGFRLD